MKEQQQHSRKKHNKLNNVAFSVQRMLRNTCELAVICKVR